MPEKLNGLFTKDPLTSLAGIAAISFAGLALLAGKCDFGQFMLAVSAIATGFGLWVARDREKE